MKNSLQKTMLNQFFLLVKFCQLLVFHTTSFFRKHFHVNIVLLLIICDVTASSCVKEIRPKKMVQIDGGIIVLNAEKNLAEDGYIRHNLAPVSPGKNFVPVEVVALPVFYGVTPVSNSSDAQPVILQKIKDGRYYVLFEYKYELDKQPTNVCCEAACVVYPDGWQEHLLSPGFCFFVKNCDKPYYIIHVADYFAMNRLMAPGANNMSICKANEHWNDPYDCDTAEKSKLWESRCGGVIYREEIDFTCRPSIGKNISVPLAFNFPYCNQKDYVFIPSSNAQIAIVSLHTKGIKVIHTKGNSGIYSVSRHPEITETKLPIISLKYRNYERNVQKVVKVIAQFTANNKEIVLFECGTIFKTGSYEGCCKPIALALKYANRNDFSIGLYQCNDGDTFFYVYDIVSDTAVLRHNAAYGSGNRYHFYVSRDGQCVVNIPYVYNLYPRLCGGSEFYNLNKKAILHGSQTENDQGPYARYKKICFMGGLLLIFGILCYKNYQK